MTPLIESLRTLALNVALLKGDPAAIHLLEPKHFHCLAVTAFAEARGEGDRGMALVIKSMVNRHIITGRSGCAIAKRAYDGYKLWHDRDPAARNNKAWYQAQLVTLNVIMGEVDLGRCEKVTHFLNPDGVRRMPRWASQENQICTVGKHVAYRVAQI